jgi:calcium/calmodulin-dependent protein kinase I
MVMELCEPFTLYDKIVQRTFLDGEVASLMKKLLEALSHCHMLRVVHRDVKPDFGSAVWLLEGRFVRGVVEVWSAVLCGTGGADGEGVQ